MIGIPTSVSLPQCEVTNTMFFVVVCPISRVGGRKAPPFENLKLSSQLGKGVQLQHPLTYPSFDLAGLSGHGMHAGPFARRRACMRTWCQVHGCTSELLCSTPYQQKCVVDS